MFESLNFISQCLDSLFEQPHTLFLAHELPFKLDFALPFSSEFVEKCLPFVFVLCDGLPQFKSLSVSTLEFKLELSVVTGKPAESACLITKALLMLLLVELLLVDVPVIHFLEISLELLHVADILAF